MPGRKLGCRFPGFGIFENAKEQQPSLDVGRHQEILFHVLPSGDTDAAREFGMRQQVADLKCASLHGVHQKSGQFVDDLVRDAPNCAGDSGLALP